MKRLSIAVIYLVVFASGINAQDAIIINHTCTDISKIPDNWIDSVQARIRLHYAHTSHGSQLTTGLAMIENNFTGYDYAIGSRYLPVENGSLCIFDGQEYATYITPELYWSTAAGMQNTGNVLTNNPELNVSMWSWCGEMSSNDSDEVQRYIDSIEVLEARYPQVQFVFMTGHTDGTGSAGDDNLRASNNQLREYCIANGKVLYDFGDIESWDPDSIYYENTSDNCAWCSTWCNEHPEDCPSCSSCAHSHCYNCFIKGKAFWWMLARLAGWEGENPAGDYTEQNAHICEGDSIFLGSAYQTIPGVYYDTLENVSGLDSIIVTTLTVNPVYNIEQDVSICNGESIYLEGADQTEPGTYQDIYTSIYGCDSIVTSTLTVNPVYNIEQDVSICNGESIYLEGADQTEPGTYQDIYTSIYGCDSIVTSTLTVNPVYNIEQDVSICNGESIYLAGADQTEPGTYQDIYTSIYGCDSIVTSTLTVNPVYNIEQDVSICNGESIYLAGADQTEPGTYQDIYTSIYGCDSIVTSTLTVNPVYNIEQDVSICNGESIYLAGADQTEPGTYQDIYTSIYGCDSIVTSTLTVNQAYNIERDVSICNGESIYLEGADQTEPGTYQDIYTSIYGCDSIVTSTLTVNPVYNIEQDVSICNGESIYLAGADRTEPGIYQDIYTSIYGCDSIVTTTLTVNQAYNIERDVSICNGESIYLAGADRTEPGIYQDIYTSIYGCDSLVKTMLHIISIDTSVIVSDGYLSANESNAVYQWINCTSNLEITGATSKDFTPEDDGFYAVEITKNGCVQISGCHQIITVDLEGIINSKGFTFSPNPVINFLNIDLGREYLTITLRVIDIRGKTLFAHKYSQKQSIQTNFSMMRDGLYFIKINADDKQKVIRITKISHY